MLHRALQQFLADVWWGDLDILLLDLPPGTGDVAISTAQLLPNAEIVVVTTPQPAAADVAVRAGTLAEQTHQKVAGVVENMSSFPCPHCGEPIDLFGMGGGAIVAETLVEAPRHRRATARSDPVRRGPARGRRLRGPARAQPPDAPASVALPQIAETLGRRPRGLAGMSLGHLPRRADA